MVTFNMMRQGSKGAQGLSGEDGVAGSTVSIHHNTKHVIYSDPILGGYW